MSKFIWEPTQEVVEYSNIYRLMQKHGVTSFQELHEKSVREMSWFWSEMEKFLGLVWKKPYEKVYDDSQGMPWTKWFVGGKINVVDTCVYQWAKKCPQKTALIWEGEEGEVRTISYGELADKTSALAAGLKSLGIKKGDRIGLYMPMLPETVMAMMAISQIGAVFLPIFSGFSAPSVATRLQDAEAIACFYVDGFYRRGKLFPAQQHAREAIAQTPSVKHKLVFQRTRELSLASDEINIQKWLDQGGCVEVEPTDAEDMLFIAYTSGTTGKPKGAVHVHGGFLVKIAEEVAFQTDMHPEDVLFWVTDMGWIMGPWEVFGGLASGGTVFLFDGAPVHPSPDRLWAMVERHRITILGLSPTLVRALLPHGTEAIVRHDLSSLRILGSTGEPWNTEPYLWLFEHVGKKKVPIINLSGGTEVGACFLSPHPIQPIKPCSLVGPALGMDVDVFDEEGRPLRGEVGELVCKRPWPGMTRGIYKDPERFIQTYFSRFKNIWVHGDWASIDEDGLIYLHGRSDDTLKIAGKRLGPAEVETVLVGHPMVKEAAAVGLEDEVKGEALGCFVVLKEKVPFQREETIRAELKQRVIDELGKAFAPRQILFVSDLPRTRSAKIVRRAVKAVATGKDPGDLSSLENPEALDEIKKLVRS